MQKDTIRYELSEMIKLYKETNKEMTSDIIDKINNIVLMITSPSYNKTPNFKKIDKFKKNRKEISEKDWEEFRSFKATDINKNNTDSYIVDIQTNLNKITSENFDIMIGKILENIHNLINEKKDIDYNKIYDVMITVIKQNLFNSEIYAELFRRLITDFSSFKKILLDNFLIIKKNIVDIKYVNSDDDYDKFCENNKINDSKRSELLFFVNLCKKEVIQQNDIIEILNFIFNEFEKKIKEKDNKFIAEEYCEQIYLIMINGEDELEQNTVWDNLIDKIRIYSEIEDTKNYPSLSNKIIFKFMDLIEETV